MDGYSRAKMDYGFWVDIDGDIHLTWYSESEGQHVDEILDPEGIGVAEVHAAIRKAIWGS